MTQAGSGPDRIELSFDPDRLDLELIHRFLSTDAYWSAGIPRALVERAIANSLCIGAYDGDAQIAFARLVTDRATFAYLADVFVVPSMRGRGCAKRMVRRLLEHDDAVGLRRILLFTADAQTLYAELGFSVLARPERAMEIARPDIYRSAEPFEES